MKTQALIQQGMASVMHTYNRYEVVLQKGEGVFVTDTAGKEYLDFVGGIAVNCLGHNNKKLVAAIAGQAAEMIHVSNLYWTERQIQLASALVESSCLHKAFFCNSGAEANEAALKLARKYAYLKSKPGADIISMENSFHGRTYGAVTATGQTHYQEGLTPLLPGIRHVPFNDVEALKAAVTKSTCAILVEPVQGEGGIVPANLEFLQAARSLCDEHDMLLVYDEVQCGMGRTGKLFAYEVSGVKPDVVTLAKGLAGGVPIGAMLATNKAAAAFAPGDHASTFGGNPLACAAASVVLEELKNGLVDHAAEMGTYLAASLVQLKNNHPQTVEQVRGLGLIQGIQITADPKAVVAGAMKKGLLLVGAGKDVVRLVPPLIVEKSHIDQAVFILECVLTDIEEKH